MPARMRAGLSSGTLRLRAMRSAILKPMPRISTMQYGFSCIRSSAVSPYCLWIFDAMPVVTPCEVRKCMTRRTAREFSHSEMISRICLALILRPEGVRTLKSTWGSASMRSNTSVPSVSTIAFAQIGPMPCTHDSR